MVDRYSAKQSHGSLSVLECLAGKCNSSQFGESHCSWLAKTLMISTSAFGSFRLRMEKFDKSDKNLTEECVNLTESVSEKE